MKKDDILGLVMLLIFLGLIVFASVSIKSCIAKSDMNPWMKAWLLFGR